MSTTERVVVGELVGVGDEADLLEELVDGLELPGEADQLGQVLEPALGLDGVLGLQLGEVAAALEHRLEHGAGPVGRRLGEVVEQREELVDAADGPPGDAGLAAPSAAPR